MGSAFTPGLMISSNATIRKKRCLPVRGNVVVNAGDWVQADTTVARVDLPGTLAVVKAAALLGCAPELLRKYCLVAEGDSVRRDCAVAERKVFFGLITNRAHAPINGTVEYVSHHSGNIGIRGIPKPISCNAYISGRVVEVLEGEGVIIETRGGLVQGIFGVGGERHGELLWMNLNGDTLSAEHITEAHSGKILVHCSRIDGSALHAAGEHGVIGLVGASIIDSHLMKYLGFDIGVAMTGEEEIPFSVILTEGFGNLSMPEKTRNLLASFSGSKAAINGATQIRAGVIRPEIIVPQESKSETAEQPEQILKIGTRVRLIRRPNFGRLGRVTSLPKQPVLIATGSHVRVLSVQLDQGSEVTIPRANVEIIDEH